MSPAIFHAGPRPAGLWATAYGWALCALAFFLPLFFNTQSISLVVLSVCGLGLLVRGKGQLVWRTQGILWLLYFAAYSLSAICSTDKAAALDDWSRKLGMPLMAVFIGLMPCISKSQFGKVAAAYILGNLLSMVWCIGYVLATATPVTRAAFFNDDLVHGLEYNAAYTSLHVFMALVLLILPPGGALPAFITRVRWPLAVLLWGFLLFLGSKLLVALGALLWIVAAARRARQAVGTRRREALAVAVMLTGITAFFLVVNGDQLAARYDSLRAGVPTAAPVTAPNHPPAGEADNLTKRRIMWKATWLAYRREGGWPVLGLGSGDLQRRVAAEVSRPGFTFGHYRDFAQLAGMNAHNMYLQSLAAAGIPALLLLLAMVGWGMYGAWRSRALSAVAFWIVAGLFLAQESALQTQAGLFPICFFSLLFANTIPSKRTEVEYN